MSQRAAFTIGSLLALFPLFCFGEQPALGSTAAMSGLRGPVHGVLTETFIYESNGKKTPGVSERTIYNRAGYETDLYESSHGLCSHGLCSHTVYTRSDGHLVKAETTNPVSKQKSVQLYNSDGFVTETDTYDDNGVLIAQTANDSSVKKAASAVPTMRSKGGNVSITERFADGSFKESIVKLDGTTIVHFHSRHVDWRQVTDADKRSLEYIEEPLTGEYLRILSRYDKAGREIETATYDRPGKLLREISFQYSREDKNGNWTEQQIWAQSDSKSAQLLQVTHRTITYYRDLADGER